MQEKPVDSGLTFIKFGGAVITEKTQASTLRADVLHFLVKEIADAWPQLKGRLILGHGQGSFAHQPAAEYGTAQGFGNSAERGRKGMALVHHTAAQLNRIVVDECISNELPAITWLASSSYSLQNKKLLQGSSAACWEMINQGMLPVTGGDVLVDAQLGCSIWSTEEVFEQLILELLIRGKKVNAVIYLTEIPGVLDKKDTVIPELTPDDWSTVEGSLFATKGVDVTGGMKLKLQHAFRLAKLGIDVKILSGNQKGNLTAALFGTNWQGTHITTTHHRTSK